MSREMAPAIPCGERSSTARATDFTRDRLAFIATSVFFYGADTE
jgi:hypothetical protein